MDTCKFKVIQKEYIKEVDSTVSVLRHECGSTLVLMPCEDSQKAISIAFSTAPRDNKGIPHIIEHSVLCGSEKYPLKDPFVQLMKGSMYTFLNAVTYNDFTVYPVAATNGKDFINLMKVYLDAAFAPLLPEKKEIFLQEGRHFEPDGDGFSCNGVVYNEMKGMEGSADYLLENAVRSALYKNTPYAFDSGGVPADIISLGFEELIAYHREHYAPSNSYIFLYGDLDMQSAVDYIEREYLSDAEPARRLFADVSRCECVSRPEPVAYCAGEEVENGCYYALAFSMDAEQSALHTLTLRLLERLLISSQGAYVKNALIDAGIGEDVYAVADETISLPFFGFAASRCRDGLAQKFEKIVRDELSRLVGEGIDKTKLSSALDRLEFEIKESAPDWLPKGIELAVTLLPGLIADRSDALDALRLLNAASRLKELAKTDYFEKFIEDYFLNNERFTLVTLRPDTQLAAKKDAELARLSSLYASKMTRDQIDSELALLRAYSDSVDSPEALELIPLLERDDLRKSEAEQGSREVAFEGGSLTFIEQPTNGIAYFEYLFDLSFLNEHDRDYARIFCELFGAVDTLDRDYKQLGDLTDSVSGGSYHYLRLAGGENGGDAVRAYLVWHSRFLYRRADDLLALNRELLLRTDFSDSRHIYDLLLALRSSYARELARSANNTAASVGLSAFSKHYAAHERLQGYEFYCRLCSLLDNFEEEKARLTDALNSILGAMRSKNAWRAVYIGESGFLSGAVKYAQEFFSLLGESAQAHELAVETAKKRSLAFTLPSQVQYVALCGRLPDSAYALRGNLLVLSKLLRTDYLWQNVRVVGGAYGCSIRLDYTGEMCMSSYRDPNVDETLGVYRALPEYLKKLQIDEKQVRRAVIGEIGIIDAPMTPYERGMQTLSRELDGITPERTAQIREQIISTSENDLIALGEIMEQAVSDSVAVVIGGETKLSECKTVFEETAPLIKN